MTEWLVNWTRLIRFWLGMKLLNGYWSHAVAWSPDGDDYIRVMIFGTNEFWIQQYYDFVRKGGADDVSFRDHAPAEER